MAKFDREVAIARIRAAIDKGTRPQDRERIAGILGTGAGGWIVAATSGAATLLRPGTPRPGLPDSLAAWIGGDAGEAWATAAPVAMYPTLRLLQAVWNGETRRDVELETAGAGALSWRYAGNGDRVHEARAIQPATLAGDVELDETIILDGPLLLAMYGGPAGDRLGWRLRRATVGGMPVVEFTAADARVLVCGKAVA